MGAAFQIRKGEKEVLGQEGGRLRRRTALKAPKGSWHGVAVIEGLTVKTIT